MPDMKFRVRGPEHAKKLQQALFRIGYKWVSTGEVLQDLNGWTYLYANADPLNGLILTYGSSPNYFASNPAAEYEYSLGLVVPLGSEDLHAHVPDLPVKMESRGLQIVESPVEKPPIGVKPRKHADKMHHMERALELRGAIERYTNALKPLVEEWVTEYNERVEAIRKLEKEIA